MSGPLSPRWFLPQALRPRFSPCSPDAYSLTLSDATEIYRYHRDGMTSADVYAHSMPSGTPRTSPEAQQLRPASPQHGTARRRRAVTIAQVAAESGLSTATVSKVLNGKPDVSPSTRVLVEDVLLKSGYRKRGNGEPPPLIDIVFNDFDSPWATEIIRGAAAAAQAEGLTVAFTALSEGDERRVWFDHITSRGTRGIILLLSQLTERQKGELVARGLPFVVIDPTAEPGPEVSSVGATNWSGGLMATKHLIDLGHHRIGIIMGPPELLCSRARFDGYRAALERAGLSVDNKLVRTGDFRVKSGYEQAKILFDMDGRPTAIFAGNDLQGLGVLRAPASWPGSGYLKN